MIHNTGRSSLPMDESFVTRKEIAWIVHDYIPNRSFAIYKLNASQYVPILLVYCIGSRQIGKITCFLCARTTIQENKTWPLSLCLPFIPLMRSQGLLISPRGRGSSNTKMQCGLCTLIQQIVSIAKPRAPRVPQGSRRQSIMSRLA